VSDRKDKTKDLINRNLASGPMLTSDGAFSLRTSKNKQQYDKIK